MLLKGAVIANEGDCGITANFLHMEEFRTECLDHKEFIPSI